MNRFSRLGACGVALVICLAPLALRAAPSFWQAASQAEFLRGTVEQLSIDEHGRLTLGPALERVFDGDVPVVWSMVAQPDGTVFLGTGHDGKIMKVTPAGTATVFHDTAELEVHALAPAPDGGLYAATSPDGRIYKIDRRGEASTFFDPEEKYIWALVADAKGTLYAATGDKGNVYRITPDGSGTLLFATKATHATALTLDASGRLLVGTGSPGRLFRIDTAGKPFLLLDTTYQEVRAMKVDGQGRIFVAGLNGRSSNGEAAPAEVTAPEPPATPNVSTEVLSFSVIDVAVTPQDMASPAPSSGNGTAAGAVYRIQPDGLWDIVWTSKNDAPYDLSLESDDTLLVATGHDGKVFRLTGNPMRPVLVARVPAEQSTTLLRQGARTLLTTANPGLLVAVTNQTATRGTYESDVKDARMVSSWGTLSWRATVPAGTRVELSTRSGNTRTPDEAWSEWSAAYTTAEGSAIASPNARYLQWRAVLTGGPASPVLTSVSAAYLQRNIRPRVESITVHPPGVVFQKPFSTGETEIAGFDEEPQERRLANQGASAAQMGAPPLGKRVYQRGLQTLAWKAEDENDDTLSYDVLYRREGETTWRPLRRGLADTLTVWDTTSVPNGTYVVKVLASDAKANPTDLALVGELESESFDIDNAPPDLTIGSVTRDGTRFLVPIDVRDADSPLKSVEYSLDGERWQAAFPRDGMLDSRREQFELRLDGSAAGRTVVIRAADALNNTTAGQVTLPAGR